jgi:hypothetical protein
LLGFGGDGQGGVSGSEIIQALESLFFVYWNEAGEHSSGASPSIELDDEASSVLARIAEQVLRGATAAAAATK